MRLIDRLKELDDKQVISMHVPGHKNMTIGYLKEIDMKYDMTEIPGLDNLHNPEGILLELNHKLSGKYEGYSAQAVVNGSTTGILAGISAVSEHVNCFVITGDAHKSVYHALDLVNADYSVAAADELDDVKEGTAVIITHPSYTGEGLKSLGSLIKKLKSKNITVIVDEAHGAHMDIAEGFLESSMNYGADFVVQSYHKMLPALTGASVVYCREQKNMMTVQKYIDYFETSSPSYLVMASIELAEEFYNDFKPEVFFANRTLIVQALREKGFEVIECDDPAKLVICRQGLRGHALDTLFRENGVYSEMTVDDGVLWCLPLFHAGDSFPLQELIKSVRSLDLSSMETTDIEKYDISELLNKKCIRTVVPYPPGVPVVIEGEKFHKEVLCRLDNYLNNNVKIEGIKENINYYMNEDES